MERFREACYETYGYHRTVQNESIWSATAKMPICRRLAADVEVDVCVVGAGIAGLTTAYLLGKEGKSVAVLDDGGLVSGMTQVTTAHLMGAIDDRFFNIEWWHGERRRSTGGREPCAGHRSHSSRSRKRCGSIAISSGLDGYLMFGAGQKEDLLDRELAAARRAGVAGVEKLPRAPLEIDSGPCLRFPRQGRFHPLKYLAGMARAIKRRGGRIFTNSHADSIEGGSTGTYQGGLARGPAPARSSWPRTRRSTTCSSFIRSRRRT